jgi:bacterioferritin-associated ferredoxin
MPINRCICFNIPFTELKEYAQHRECGMEKLREHFGCGRGCALCVPYIKAMLETGQTSFEADWTPTAPD